MPSVHEAVEFFNVARASQTGFEIKGGHPLTENYSVLVARGDHHYGRRAIAECQQELQVHRRS